MSIGAFITHKEGDVYRIRKQQRFAQCMQVIIATVLAAVIAMMLLTPAHAGGGTPGLRFPCTEDDGQATIAYGGTSTNEYTQWDSSHGASYIEYQGTILSFVAPDSAQTWENNQDGSKRIWTSGQQVDSKHFFVDCYLPVPSYPYSPGHLRPSSIDVAEWLLQQSNDVSFGNPEVQKLAAQLQLRKQRVKLWKYVGEPGEPRIFNTPWGVEIITQSKTYRAGELTTGIDYAYIRFTEVDNTP